ncbi:hypothetical protein Xph01_02250 [Micromonospora phaseoli]|nr:hypothetical protein Xph01_02250 [Micromonospora phaseoli]
MRSAAHPAGPVPVRKRSPTPRFRGVLPVAPHVASKGFRMGSVVKKRRKRMAKKKHRKLLRKTRVQRRRLGK